MAFYSVIKRGHLTAIQHLIRHHPDLKIYSHPFPFFSIFKLVSERKLADAFSVPFFIYEGNTEVTFHSLLMEPREKDIKSSDGCGSFLFFFPFFWHRVWWWWKWDTFVWTVANTIAPLWEAPYFSIWFDDGVHGDKMLNQPEATGSLS